jgi:hypothetical protein
MFVKDAKNGPGYWRSPLPYRFWNKVYAAHANMVKATVDKAGRNDIVTKKRKISIVDAILAVESKATTEVCYFNSGSRENFEVW